MPFFTSFTGINLCIFKVDGIMPNRITKCTRVRRKGTLIVVMQHGQKKCLYAF